MNITPQEFQDLDNQGARDLVWKYIEPFRKKSPGKRAHFPNKEQGYQIIDPTAINELERPNEYRSC